METNNLKRKLFLGFVSISMIILFTSCGSSDKSKKQTEETSENEIVEETIETKSNEATIIVEDSSN